MKPAMLPANVDLWNIGATDFSFVAPVSSLDIVEGNSVNFHDEGLFSTRIFGRVGSDERDLRPSYIDVGLELMHPLIFDNLMKLRGLYSAIIQGKGFAKWNNEEKDFEPSDEIHGETGYYFFSQYCFEIVHKQTGSDSRDNRIKFIERYKRIAWTRRVPIMPAGLRDAYRDQAGRLTQGEVNEFYRGLLRVANTVPKGSEMNPILDTARMSAQNAYNGIYQFSQNLVDGKRGFASDKWASRNIYNGTRNVLTSMDTASPVLGRLNSPKHNHTLLGVYQQAKATLPKTHYNLRSGWLNQVFNDTTGYANLVDPKTLKMVTVQLPSAISDRFTTTDGIDKIINSLSEPELRHRPVMAGKYFIGLIYRGPDNTYRIFSDIDELPEDRSREHVTPLTLVELVYLTNHLTWRETPTFVTRYPITGVGSTYASMSYVKTTTVGEMRSELDEGWNKSGVIALEVPKLGEVSYVDSMAPHPSRLKGLSADFDGDVGSANSCYTSNSRESIKAFMETPLAYLDSNGNFKASPFVEVVNFVLHNFTGGPR